MVGVEPVGKATRQGRETEEKTKGKTQKPALVPVRGADFIEILERILSKGIVVETEKGTLGTPEAAEGRSAWIEISIAGVEVFKLEAGLSVRSLMENEEREEEEE